MKDRPAAFLSVVGFGALVFITVLCVLIVILILADMAFPGSIESVEKWLS